MNRDSNPNRMMKQCFLFVVFQCFVLAALAQPERILFDHHTPDNGFRGLGVRAIVKGHDGLLWMSSDDGLIRFDGAGFKYFKHNSADTTTISDGQCSRMQQDGGGRLWVLVRGGLDHFDPATGRFRHVLRADRKRQSAERLFARDVRYDPQNKRTWFATNKGVFFCRDGRNGIEPLLDARQDTALRSFGPVLQCVVPGANGILWVGSSDGLFSYDLAKGTTRQYHIPSHKAPMDDGIFCLYPDGDGYLWLGTWVQGLVRFEVATGYMQQYFYSDPTREQNAVTDIVQSGQPGQEHLLWLSCHTAGFMAFNTQTGKFRSYRSSHDQDPFGIRGQTNSLCATPTEGIWISSQRGLHRYDFFRQVFQETDFAQNNPALRNMPVQYLCVQPMPDRKDRFLWMYIPYFGAYRYDLQTGLLSSIPAALARFLNKDSRVTEMVIDSNHTLWCSTYQDGLTGYDLMRGKAVQTSGTRFFAENNILVYVLLPGRGQQLWLGCGTGLYRLDRNSGKVVAIEAVNQQLQSHPVSPDISALCFDSRGRIWFVTHTFLGNASVGCYDPARDTALFFYHEKDKVRGFVNEDELTGIVCDAADRLYVGSRKGLMWFDANQEQPVFSVLTEQQGLGNNWINNLVIDAHSNVWCVTLAGLSCFNTRGRFFVNYNTASGLGDAWFPRMSVSPNDGAIYLGQHGGFDRFMPGQLITPPAPKVLFTGLTVADREYLPEGRFVKEGDLIRLPYDQHVFQVEFAAMSFTNAHENQYAYRLEGADAGWHFTKNTFVAFNNLQPGTYTLQVKAANSYGVWNDAPVALRIYIAPPFWRTWWFYLLVALAVGGLVYYLIRQRFEQIRERFQLRNRIASDLHDEIGSTLTSISILSSVSQQSLESNPGQTKEMLEQIATQSKAIQQSMSDIVWALRPGNEQLGNLLARIREFAAQTLESQNIRTVINIDEPLLQKKLPVDFRKEVLLICKEALHNIARHAGATEVAITLRQQGQQLLLDIRDNGRWKENPYGSGTGTSSMKFRAAAIGGSLTIEPSGTGTCVQLAVPVT